PLTPSACSILMGKSCDGALQSPMSKQLGLPLAGWGIVFYGTLAALLLLGWFLGDAFGFESALAALMLSAAGAVLSALLLVSMLVSAAPFCPMCAGVHVINFLLVPCYKRLAGRPAVDLIRALGASVVVLVTGKAGSDAPGLLKLLAMLVVTLIAV